MQIALRFPFNQPDGNGVTYSRQAVERAVSGLYGRLPILFRDNKVCPEGAVIGHTAGDTAQVLWDDDHQVCEVVLNASVYYGGTECIAKTSSDGIVTEFEITAIGISR